MYPVGVLFGLGKPFNEIMEPNAENLKSSGFDTASSIALLAVSALARKNDGHSIPSSHIVILPVRALFISKDALLNPLSIVPIHSGHDPH